MYLEKNTKIGKKGAIVIPAALRKNYGLKEGSQVVMEARPEGVLLRPVVTLPVEIYTKELKAEFLLNNTATAKDYAEATKEVTAMGLDPKAIPHKKPDMA